MAGSDACFGRSASLADQLDYLPFGRAEHLEPRAGAFQPGARLVHKAIDRVIASQGIVMGQRQTLRSGRATDGDCVLDRAVAPAELGSDIPARCTAHRG